MKKQPRRADKAKARQRKNIIFRMNFLFFIVFILFSLLILRLGYLQIVKHEDFVLDLERKEEIAVNTSVPRGRIFDREGGILVDNEPKNAITYTKLSSTTSKEMLETAEELAKLIDQDTKRVTIGDKRDYWILKNPDEAAEKVTEEDLEKISEDGSATKDEIQREVTRLTRERITDEELNSFTDHELKVLAIYREMMSGYAFAPQIVKSGEVSEEEFAAVSERLGESKLAGVNTTTDWERVKKSSNTFLGSTTSPSEGVPRSHLDYYLARDYSRNDRVGKSFIEQSYEELLQGQKSIVKNVKDRTGKVIETVTVREGEPGKDLILTIDTELQLALEEIVSSKLLQLKSRGSTQALDKIFVVMMDPNNGEILSLVGKHALRNRETGRLEVRDYAFGTFTDAYMAGSTVKMATVLTGYQAGGAHVGEVKIDEMLKLGAQTKSSIFNPTYNRIPMNDIRAIGQSSNVYMFKTAIKLGGGSYSRGRLSLGIEPAYSIMKNGYASFGLGTETGIDLPNEASGFTKKPENPGLLLDYSIGQFATYTPLQLAQYVSTIANGGYRIAPKVLKEIREPSPDGEHFGPLVQETDIKVLNRINNTDQEIEQIKKGMNYTYYGANGTARGLFNGKPYRAAGKTGTAQDGVMLETKADDGTVTSRNYYRTINQSHVGFAPADQPEIAYAVVIPNLWTSTRGYPPAANEITAAIVDKYFELKAKKGPSHNEPVQTIKKPIEKDQE